MSNYTYRPGEKQILFFVYQPYVQQTYTSQFWEKNKGKKDSKLRKEELRT